MYWEPAKYVAKLRALKTDQNPLLFKINMDPPATAGLGPLRPAAGARLRLRLPALAAGRGRRSVNPTEDRLHHREQRARPPSAGRERRHPGNRRTGPIGNDATRS